MSTRIWVGGTAIVVSTVIAAILATGGGEPTITCDLNATTANFAAQVTASTTGQTICLAAGDYGTWNGTNKSITITPADGASPEIYLELASGDSNFTIEGRHETWDDTVGLTINGANFQGGASGPTNITIRDSYFIGGKAAAVDGPGACGSSTFGLNSGCIQVPLADAMTSRNVLIDHNVFKNIEDHDPDVTGFEGTEAAIHWSDEGTSGWTVTDNLFIDILADGLKIGGDVTANNNKFVRVAPPEPNDEDIHADAIQIYTADGSNIRGNWIQDCEQGLSGFDGIGIETVTHNLITDCTTWHIGIYAQYTAHGDYTWNTINSTVDDISGNTGRIECTRRPADPVSIPTIRNNVARRLIIDSGDCTPTANDHNLCNTACGNGTSQASGTPVFVGGADPGTWDSFADGCLLAGPGFTAASDGGQVGICGGDYNAATDGPPTGEGY